jgi:hypothetical protein
MYFNNNKIMCWTELLSHLLVLSDSYKIRYSSFYRIMSSRPGSNENGLICSNNLFESLNKFVPFLSVSIG